MYKNRFMITNIMLFVLSVVSLMNVFVAEFMPGRSSYSFNLGVLDCNNIEPHNNNGCRHEIGHKMDDDLGMPSLTPEFAVATQATVQAMMISLQPNDMAIFISVYPDKDPRELYAGIYAYVEGDISRLPKDLRPFFSADESYLDLYDCLAQDGLNICGRSISILKG